MLHCGNDKDPFRFRNQIEDRFLAGCGGRNGVLGSRCPQGYMKAVLLLQLSYEGRLFDQIHGKLDAHVLGQLHIEIEFGLLVGGDGNGGRWRALQNFQGGFSGPPALLLGNVGSAQQGIFDVVVADPSGGDFGVAENERFRPGGSESLIPMLVRESSMSTFSWNHR